MPLNSAAYSFKSLQTVPVYQPSIKEPSAEYTGITLAQAAANGALTSKAITSTATLVEGGTLRAKGMYLIVPSDVKTPVTFANQSTLVAITPAPPGGTGLPTVTTSSSVSPLGFAVPPGVAIFLSAQFNDPVYAITPTGTTATIYFVDP